MADLLISKVDSVHYRVDSPNDGILRDLRDALTFEVPNAKFHPKVRYGQWDGKIRLYNYRTGLIYAGLHEKIVEFAEQNNYEYLFREDPSANELSVFEAKEFIKSLNLPHEPHDYQLEAFIEAIRYERRLFVSPTASGKSLIIYLIVRYLLKRTLIIVDRINLVNQLYDDFVGYGFDSEKFVQKSTDEKIKNPTKPILITTWQSIYKKPKAWFKNFDVVIGDEVHKFEAKNLTKITEKLVECDYRYGFTGTLKESKTHEWTLEGLFGPIRDMVTTKELMDRGKIAQLDIKIIALKHSKDSCKQVMKDINAAKKEARKNKKLRGKAYKVELDYLISSHSRNNFIANLALSLDSNVIVMYRFVENHGKVLYDMIRKRAGDRKVFFIHGDVSGDTRSDIQETMKTEKNAIIVASYGTFSTGVNIPNLDCGIFASPIKGNVEVLQTIGRLLRKTESKTSAKMFDIGDDLRTAKTKNTTLQHLMDRIAIYNSKQFKYKIYSVNLK